MVVLLTEDSGSGYKFWKTVNKYVFNNRLYMYHTGFGSDKSGAGNSRFRYAAEALLKAGRIDENTDIVLIYDSFAGVSEDMAREVRTAYSQLYDCKLFLKEHNIRYHELRRYICWEQLVLSFTGLPELLPVVHYTDTVVKYLHNVKIFTAQVPDINSLSAYFGIGHKTFKSVEQGMSALLNHLTFKATPNSFKTFLISKGIFADCWWDDCDSIRKNNPGIEHGLCDKCGIAGSINPDYLKIGKNRFLYIVNNSQIKNVCKEIWRLTLTKRCVNKVNVQN